MSSLELKAEIAVKSIELEQALQENKPREECLRIYKQLKELKYNLLQIKLTSDEKRDLEIA